MFRLKAGGNYYMNKFGFKGYGGGGGRRLVFVYDLQQGLEAILDSIYLTQLRTAAVSAVATRYMARPEAATLGIIGTGKEARTQLEAINKVRPLKHVKAYSRSAENRENFAREMSERTGVPVEPVESGEECVRNVDIATTITSASEPVLFGAWLAEGTHINGIGATTMFRRELDEEAVARSSPVVVEHLPQAEAELGQLIYAAARGKLRWPLVRELKDVVSGLIRGRAGPRTLRSSPASASAPRTSPSRPTSSLWPSSAKSARSWICRSESVVQVNPKSLNNLGLYSRLCANLEYVATLLKQTWHGDSLSGLSRRDRRSCEYESVYPRSADGAGI